MNDSERDQRFDPFSSSDTNYNEFNNGVFRPGGTVSSISNSAKSASFKEGNYLSINTQMEVNEGIIRSPDPPSSKKRTWIMGGVEETDMDGNLSIQSPDSVLTDDGISDKLGFAICCMAIFVADMARGIFFPTMWNLVQTFDGGDEVLLGYVSASFSFGRTLVMPLFGSWSSKYGYRWTLICCTSISMVGAIMFTQVLSVGEPWFLLLTNTIAGIGSGTLGVTRAYASEVTPKRLRTGYMALTNAVQYAGNTVTPILGSLFIMAFRRDENENLRGFPDVNEFTAPAMFMVLSWVFLLFFLIKYFEEVPRENDQSSAKKLSSKRKAQIDLANSTTCFGTLTLYTACLLGCMFLNGSLKGPMSCFEALGIEFAETKYDLDRSYVGTIISIVGFLGALTLLMMKLSITQDSDDTMLVSAGLVVFIAGITINLRLDEEDPENNPGILYVTSMFLIYSVGYPICHTALVGLFSKVVGRRPQGTLLGFYGASGTAARVMFPIISGYIIAFRNIETVFMLLVIVLSLSLISVLTFRRILMELSQ